MIGYVIVVAMVACAVATVVIVTSSLIDPREPVPTPRTAAPPRVVIAALGASDATGEGAQDPERENWVAQLATRLPVNVDVVSFGVGGAWLGDARVHQVARAIAIQPDIVIAWLIVNDLTQGAELAQYIQDLDAVLADLSQSGTRVVLGNAPRLWELPAFTGNADDMNELRREVERWNAGLADVAASYGVVIVDLSENPVAPEDLAADGFHPSTAGHAKLAATFKPYVLAAIDQTRAVRLNDHGG